MEFFAISFVRPGIITGGLSAADAVFPSPQADLNWNIPEVREEIKEILRFWKRKGIIGFGFDVISLASKPEVMENDLKGDERRFYIDGPHIHEYLKELVRDGGLRIYGNGNGYGDGVQKKAGGAGDADVLQSER